VLIDLFAKIKESLDDLDMDTAEGVCNELDKYSYSDNQKDYPKKIRSACDDIDIDQCLEIISDWEKII
jgi:hypothetical protein